MSWESGGGGPGVGLKGFPAWLFRVELNSNGRARNILGKGTVSCLVVGLVRNLLYCRSDVCSDT